MFRKPPTLTRLIVTAGLILAVPGFRGASGHRGQRSPGRIRGGPPFSTLQ